MALEMEEGSTSQGKQAVSMLENSMKQVFPKEKYNFTNN